MGNKDYTKFSNNSEKEFKKEENKQVKNNDRHVVSPELEQTVLKAGGEVMRVDQNNVVVEGVNEIPKDADVVDNVILPGNAKLMGVVVPAKLNVRKQPSKDSEVLEVITKNSEVEIDLSDNEDTMFYKVHTKSGIDGYCMTEFINIK